MNTTSKTSSKSPVALTLTSSLLIACLALLGMGGLVGGVAFLVDPSGATIGMSTEVLANAPVNDFAWPGLFLFLVMGLLPFIIAFGIWERPRWRWTDPFNRWTHEHWSWTATVALAIVLILWLGWEVVLFGYQAQVQLMTGMIGVILLFLCFLPVVRKNFELPRWA